MVFCCLYAHHSKSLPEQDLCTPFNGWYAWTAFPTSGFPLSPPSSMSDPAQPPPLCAHAVCSDALGLFINGVTHFLRSLSDVKPSRPRSWKFFFFLPCRFEENLQSRLFISRHPPLPPPRLSSGCFFFEEACYVAAAVFARFVPPETTRRSSSFLLAFHIY